MRSHNSVTSALSKLINILHISKWARSSSDGLAHFIYYVFDIYRISLVMMLF